MKFVLSEIFHSKHFLSILRIGIFTSLILSCGIVSSCSNSLMGPSTVEQDDPDGDGGEDPDNSDGSII